MKSASERAVRDNDLIYCSPVPPATQLAPIVGAGMVKLVTPKEVAEPISWLMTGEAGVKPLFSALVPYGVHLALSVYTFRPQFVKLLIHQAYTMTGKIRSCGTLTGRGKSWTDLQRGGLSSSSILKEPDRVSTLQSLNLPGSMQALERPVGLPPSLLRKAEEVDSAGGVDRVKGLLAEVDRLSRANSQLLSEVSEI